MRDSWNGQERHYFADNSSRFEDISLEAADGDEEWIGEILRLEKLCSDDDVRTLHELGQDKDLKEETEKVDTEREEEGATKESQEYDKIMRDVVQNFVTPPTKDCHIPLQKNATPPTAVCQTNTENTTENTNRDYPIHPSTNTDEARKPALEEGEEGSEWINDILYTPGERRDHVLENVDYAWHIINETGQKRKEYEDLVSIVCDVVCGEYKSSISIGGAKLPAQIVKERFWNLTAEHIEYVRGCLDALENRNGIKSMKNYLLTCLYNSSITMDQYFKQKMHNDQSTGTWRKEKHPNEELYQKLSQSGWFGKMRIEVGAIIKNRKEGQEVTSGHNVQK